GRHHATGQEPHAAARRYDHGTAGQRTPARGASRHLHWRCHRACRRALRACGPRSDCTGVARGDPLRRSRRAALCRVAGGPRRAIERPGWSEMRAVTTKRAYTVSRAELLIPGTAHSRWHRAPRGAVASDGLAAMKVWLALALILAVALALAACAGHEWASPFDLVSAFAGDADMRSRLLVEWRGRPELAGRPVGVVSVLWGGHFYGGFSHALAAPYLLWRGGGS